MDMVLMVLMDMPYEYVCIHIKMVNLSELDDDNEQNIKSFQLYVSFQDGWAQNNPSWQPSWS